MTIQWVRELSSKLDHIQPGNIVGPYRIVRGFKGRGGMARVFEIEVREKYQHSSLPRRWDARSDVLSLSIVLYEMLTGISPFQNIALVDDPTHAPKPPTRRAPTSTPAPTLTPINTPGLSCPRPLPRQEVN